jgi:hypothetical protein
MRMRGNSSCETRPARRTKVSLPCELPAKVEMRQRATHMDLDQEAGQFQDPDYAAVKSTRRRDTKLVIAEARVKTESEPTCVFMCIILKRPGDDDCIDFYRTGSHTSDSFERSSLIRGVNANVQDTKLTLQFVVRRIFALVEHIVRLGLQFEVFR